MNNDQIKFTQLANFQPKQIEAWYTLLDPVTKYLLFGGAAGGGKSYLLRWAAVGLSMYFFTKYGIRGVPIGLFSEDYPTLRDRQVTKISREFPAWLGVLKETQRDGLAFYMAPEFGSGMILLRNLDNPSKYASVEFAAILVEELTKNKAETFEDLRIRMRFPGIEERKFLAATNPGQVGHGWVKKKWVIPDQKDLDVEQERFRFIQSIFTDNKYNPSDYDKQLEAIKDKHKREALKNGSWSSFEGQYFEEWIDSLHIIKSFIPFKSQGVIVGGMDWGRTNPFSFHLSLIQRIVFHEKVFYRSKTFFEAYGTNKRPKEWSDSILERLKDFNLSLSDIAWVRADPKIFSPQDDGSVGIYEQFVKANDGWRIIKPANNDRIPGWEQLHNWLSIAPDGSPYWQITENCTNLVRTLPDQVHDENNVEDLDTEGEDHAADDQRYEKVHLKWIDAGPSGGVAQFNPNSTTKPVAPRFIGEKQVSINTDLFATPQEPTGSGVGGIRH